MKKTVIIGTVLAVATTVASLAHAGDASHKGEHHRKPGIEGFLDKGGKMTREEFDAAWRTRAEAEFKRLDRNGDGVIDKDEFLAGASERQAKMFKRLDRDGDGVIDMSKWQERAGKKGNKHKAMNPEGDDSLSVPPAAE